MESVSGAPMGMMMVKGCPVTTMPLRPGCTLPAFTDGLVERLIETGPVHTRQPVSRDGKALSELGAGPVSKSTPRGFDDDIANLEMRWTD